MARRSCCFAWHGVVQDVQTALKACARCCQGVTPLSSVPRQLPQSSRCDVCEHGASGERCVSSSLHVLSRPRRCSAGLWHRVWPTACRCRLLSSLALAFAAHTLCHRACNHGRTRSYTRYLYRLLTLKVIHGCPRPTVPAGRTVIAANPVVSSI